MPRYDQYNDAGALQSDDLLGLSREPFTPGTFFNTNPEKITEYVNTNAQLEGTDQVDGLDAALAAKADKAITISAGGLLTGGGDLSANRMITLNSSAVLQPANNLSDVANATTSRTNLGLGTAATQNSTTFLQVANNLSDLNNATTARTNLGLGTLAVQNASGITTDVTLTNSTLATDRMLEIVNSAADSTSDAILSVRAGNGNTADAYMRILNDQFPYSLGVKRNDSSSLLLCLNGGLNTSAVAMRMSQNGEFNYPFQPLFLAYLSSSVTNVTGDGTTYTIIANTEVRDQNSDYNNSTGVFTAPVAGTYLFFAGVDPSSLSASVSQLNYQIVTSNRTYTLFSSTGVIRDSGNNFINKHAVVADMDAGDTASLTFHAAGTTKTVGLIGNATNPLTCFGGYLIG